MGQLPFRQIHLDFHTSENIGGIGEDFDARQFVNTLKAAHVNSINLFAKCHHGWMYYDSAKYRKHPSLKTGLLEKQVEACHAEGIPAPIYLSVCFDELSAREHPEWIERKPTGAPWGAPPLLPGWKKLCLNSPYVDYFEDQVLDLLDTFNNKVDGVWMDIVLQKDCCCNFCLERMLCEGLDPEKDEDRWNLANRVILEFKKRLTGTIRQHSSECQIFYNAGHVGPYIRSSLDCYTHLELESLPGLRAGWGYEHFPITARFAKNLGKEYIGMTGKFHRTWGDFGGFKNQAALEYECFATVSMGAKCCIGDQLHPSGRICPATYELIGSIYSRIEQMEPWLIDARPMADIAVFTSESPTGTQHSGLNPPIRGAYRMLEELHACFDVVDDESPLDSYRLLILPDVITLDDTRKKKIEDFISGGGKVILSHHSGLNEEKTGFALADCCVQYQGESEFETEYVLVQPDFSEGFPSAPVALYGKGAWVEPNDPATVIADLWKPYFNRTWRHFCSHNQAPPEGPSGHPAAVMNDSVAYLSHPIFSMYHIHGVRVYRQLLAVMINHLLPDPMILTDAPTSAHVTLTRQENPARTVAHLLHYIPEARYKEMDTVEDVIPLYNIQLSVKFDQQPEKAYLAPSGREIGMDWLDGYASVIAPEVKGHQMIVFE